MLFYKYNTEFYTSAVNIDNLGGGEYKNKKDDELTLFIIVSFSFLI